MWDSETPHETQHGLLTVKTKDHGFGVWCRCVDYPISLMVLSLGPAESRQTGPGCLLRAMQSDMENMHRGVAPLPLDHGLTDPSYKPCLDK